MTLETLGVTDANLVPAALAETQTGVAHAFLRRRLAVTALVVFGLVVLAALLAPILGLPDPNAQALTDRLQGPGWHHLLGTDELGRDEFVRILSATRVSLWATVQATLVGIVLGVPLGLITGYAGGWIDGLLSRTFDSVQSVPPLILAIAIVAIFGRSLTPAMIAIGIVFSPTFYRVSRAAASTVASETYVEASKAMGQRSYKIISGHVLGNVSSVLIVQMTTTLAFGILAEASLSYLGLGVQPPSASLGSMLTSAANLLNASPQLTVEPGLVIVLLVLCISLVGDALRDISSGIRDV
ncbi:MAG: peptide/nickel transport system permease protein [Pseudonocardiales bacterium]|nr:peptide/nickel transport system permease protein [Pseudonocardiales bacterium]